VTRLSTAWWFLRRPRYAREFRRRVINAVHPRRSSALYDPVDRREAEGWCAPRAQGTEQALSAIAGHPMRATLRAEHGEALQDAERRVRDCGASLGGPADMELLYGLAEHLRARHVVETGVAYGWSALAVLLSLAHRPGSRLMSTDFPYMRPGAERCVGIAVPGELATMWTLIRQPDRDGLPRALRALPAVDLCHYDSDKSSAARRWAYPVLWRALRPGGVFVSDDVGDNVVFMRFAEEIGVEPIVVAAAASTGPPGAGSPGWTKYVGVLVKPGR
jgi:predicted O-methyltransferase YrrM